EARSKSDVLAPNRAAHQELLRVVSGLVVVIHEAVGRTETPEPLNLAAGADRRVKHLAGCEVAVVFEVEEEIDHIAVPDAAAEVGLIGMDPHDLQDRVSWEALLHASPIESRVERGRQRLVLVAE